MADQGKSNGERISQIVLVLITAVIGPIAVWYVTNPASPMNNQAATPTALVATIVSQAEVTPATGEVAANPTSTTAAALPADATPTTAAAVPESPTPVKPGSKLPGGTPVVMDGLALTVSPADVTVDGELIGLFVHLTNQLTETQTISFSPETIRIKDNTGKDYQVYFGDGKGACKKPDLGKKKELKVEAGSEIVLAPLSGDQASEWCSDGKDTVLPYFLGPFAKDAKSLTVTFESFGPFKGISFEIDL